MTVELDADGQLSIRYVPLDELIEDPANAKAHDEDEIRRAIERFGFVEPEIVDERTGRILAGHGRTKTLQRMSRRRGAQPPRGILVADDGRWLVPTVAGVRSEDDAEARAMLVGLNGVQESGGWNTAKLVEALAPLRDETALQLAGTGFDFAELDRLIAEVEAENRPDPEPEPPEPSPPAEPVARAGDVWHIGPHTVIVGDCTDRDVWDVLLGDRSIDVTLTSFPYGVGLDYGDEVEDSIENVRRLLDVVPGILAERTRAGGYAVVNFADLIAGKLAAGVDDELIEYPMALDYWPAFRAAGWTLHSRRIWAKPHARVSAPWTANSNRAACDWEHLWSWRKPGARAFVARTERSALGVWDTSRMEGVEHGKELHPAAFPASMAELVLEVHSRRGELVVDPFLGTGSTIIAAHRRKRVGAGIELVPRSADLAIARIVAHTRKPAIRQDGAEFPVPPDTREESTP